MIFIKNVQSGKFLAANGTNGSPLVQWDFTGDGTQQWELVEIGAARSLPDGSVEYGLSCIRNVASGRVIDVPNSSHGSGIQLTVFDFHGGQNQSWTATDLPPDRPNLFHVRNGESGLLMNVQGNSTDNGAPIIQFPMEGNLVTPNELWEKIKG